MNDERNAKLRAEIDAVAVEIRRALWRLEHTPGPSAELATALKLLGMVNDALGRIVESTRE